MPETWEIVIFFLVVVLGSIITVWIYGRIVRGIPIAKEEREVVRAGRLSYARERKERKR